MVSPDSKIREKTATESHYVPSLKRGFSTRLEPVKSQEVLPENWFSRMVFHGLDGGAEDLE